jgi:cell division protein FtsI (penicillin-binding protein 3)
MYVRSKVLQRIYGGLVFSLIAALTFLHAFRDVADYPHIAPPIVVTDEVAAMRGMVTDRDGNVLARTIETRHVFADQVMVTDPAGVAGKLSPLLDIPVAELEPMLSGDDRFVYLAKNVSTEIWRQIEILALPGIAAERVERRNYPEGKLAANVLGFVNGAGSAQEGIERMYDETLAGTLGEISYLKIGSYRGAEQSNRPAINGSHISLTIDRDIQYIAQQAIAAKVKEANAESGTVIVMNAKTGEILAMATAPTFNPNRVLPEDIAYLGNRAVTEIYEPGSTGKIMTMAAVIDAGVSQPNSKFVVPNRLKRSDKVFSDHEDHPTLRLTLTGVLAQSSNIGSILAAEKISKNKLYDYFKAFGIGSPTGLNFRNEARGHLAKPKEWWGSTEFTMAFGQGYSLNSLQAASVFATIANDGVRVTPTIVKSITEANGTVRTLPLGTEKRVVSAATARQVRLMMESVVSEQGTAPNAQIPGYRVAGKTGTAQYSDPKCGCYNGYVASFIGFAPADQPELVVAVNLVRPKNGHYGGVLAGPVFKEVMTYALQKMGIPPTGSARPRLAVSW